MKKQNFLLSEIEKGIQAALKKTSLKEMHHGEIEIEEEDCGCNADNTKIIKGQLLSILLSAKSIYHSISNSSDSIEDWIASKISLADENLKSACIHLQEYGNFSMSPNVVLTTSIHENQEETESEYNEALDPTKDDDDLFEKSGMNKPDNSAFGMKMPSKNIKMEQPKK